MIISTPAIHCAAGVAGGKGASIYKAHKRGGRVIIATGVIGQGLLQAEVAKGGGVGIPKETDVALVTTYRQVANHITVALKRSGEEVVIVVLIFSTIIICSTVPYRLPAAIGGDEVRGLAVTVIQGVAIGAVPAPGGAITIGVKVKVAHQFIAITARIRAAGGDTCCIGGVFVTGARQVMTHVVEHGQVVDLDQAIAIGISLIDHLQGGGDGLAGVGIRCGDGGLYRNRLRCGAGSDQASSRVNTGTGTVLNDASGDRSPAIRGGAKLGGVAGQQVPGSGGKSQVGLLRVETCGEQEGREEGDGYALG